MVVAISSIDFVVVESHLIPERRIMVSASDTSILQFIKLAYLEFGRRSVRISESRSG